MSAQEPIVTDQPCLRNPSGDDRIIEELVDLLAAALVADVGPTVNHMEFQAGENSTVVSPPGQDHKSSIADGRLPGSSSRLT